MKARVKWVQDVTFVGESGSGHAVVMDGAPDAGGRNIGFRPMEMLLIGLGGCSGMSAQDKNTAVGAGIGAVGGAVLTGGSTIGTVGGAAVGGVIGSQVGK